MLDGEELMKTPTIPFFAFLLSSSLAAAEVIDVSIKGVDNGKQSSKQEDYAEAVLNAKLQAIERAGTSIESITKIENFMLKSDVVEARSKALLLPGFQVIDIGYVSDGTYQVVLVGRLQIGKPQAQGDRTHYPLIDLGDGTVLDDRTGVLWQKERSPGTFTQREAQAYCRNLSLGGYADWRLPRAHEYMWDSMATLQTGKEKKHPLFTDIKGRYFSSSYALQGGQCYSVGFEDDGRIWTRGAVACDTPLQAHCVRVQDREKYEKTRKTQWNTGEFERYADRE